MPRQTVVDLAKWNPPQRVIRKGKRTVVEKLNPCLNRKVVDMDGNVMGQSASNGIANRDPHDPYGMQIHAEKMLGNPRSTKGTPGGVLPYSKCPQGISGVRQFLDVWELGGRPVCETAHNGKPISNSDACACIEELIAKRQAASRERALVEEERMNKTLLLQERAAAANLEAGVANAAAAKDMAEAARALAAAASVSKKTEKPGSEK
jgi:hypothetical protein